MRRNSYALLLGMLGILTACGDKGQPAQGPAGGAPATSGSAKFDENRLAELQGRTVQGFDARPGPLTLDRTVLHLEETAAPAGRGLARVMLVFEPCNAFSCPPLDGNAWKGKEAEFVAGLGAPGHRANPELVWDHGSLDLGGGRSGVFTYVCSFVQSADGKSRERLLTYKLRFHDGANSITLDINPTSAIDATSTEQLAALLPKEAGAELARSIFQVFGDAYGS